MEARVGALECAYSQVADRLNGMDGRLGGIERLFESLEQRIDVRFNWLTGIVVGTWSTIMLAILFHH